jgi:hypothetical protein
MIHQALSGALFEPRRQFALSLREQPIAAVLTAYLLAGFSWVLSDFLIHDRNRALVSLLGDFLVFTGLLSAAFAIGIIFLHFFAGLLGGRGSATSLFWGVTQSAAPLVLLVPLALLASQLGRWAGLVYLPGKLGIFLWILGCQVVAISEAYRLSVARSTYVFFLAWGTALLGFLILSVLVPLAALAKLSLVAG